MYWINKNWKVLLVVMNALILIMVSIWFCYWSNLNLGLNSENAALFNNIATPIVTAVSGVLIYLALKASIKQNQISVTQGLKGNFEQEFDLLKEQLKFQTYHFEHNPDHNVQRSVHQPVITRNSINVFTFFSEIQIRLSEIEDYNCDLQNFYDNILFDRQHFENRHRAYVDYIKFVNPFALHGVQGIKRVKQFLEKVDSSDLFDQDKNHFKHRVRQELLDEYLQFCSNSRMTIQQFMVPLIYSPRKDGKVEFIPFGYSKVCEDYEFLNSECP